MEAMACGLPVVTTRVGYIKKYVKNGTNGVTFQKQNSSSLAKKLLYLIRRPGLRERLGTNARRTIVEKYSWQKTCLQLLESFKPFQ